MFKTFKKLVGRSEPKPVSTIAGVKTILHIDSSILGPYSASRILSADIVSKLKAAHPRAPVIRRDLVADPAQHLSAAHIAAFQGGDISDAALGKDLAKGGAFIDDLFAADLIVIGAPMYNFSIASQLKGWIDRVCVAGRTFRYTPNGPEGLLPAGKKVFVVSTRGGVYTSGPATTLEHHESYLLVVLGFIGLTDITIVRAEGLNIGETAKATAMARAKAQIEALAT